MNEDYTMEVADVPSFVDVALAFCEGRPEAEQQAMRVKVAEIFGVSV